MVPGRRGTLSGIRLLGRLAVADMHLPAAIAARDADAPFAHVATINAQILLLAENRASGLREAHAAAWLRLPWQARRKRR